MNLHIPSCLNRFAKSNLLIAGAVMLSSFSLSSFSAFADLKVCNTTEAAVGVSVGYRLTDGWMTEGWWRIPADKCISVFEGDLNSRYFYLHAEDAVTGGRWHGPVFMCTSSKKFKILGLKNCFSRGYERTGFFEVDTEDQKNWQVRLKESGKTKPDKEKK